MIRLKNTNGMLNTSNILFLYHTQQRVCVYQEVEHFMTLSKTLAYVRFKFFFVLYEKIII